MAQVAWYLGDTTDSLAMVSSGIVDVAVTYNPAAEKILVDTGDVVQRVYGFRVSHPPIHSLPYAKSY